MFKLDFVDKEDQLNDRANFLDLVLYEKEDQAWAVNNICTEEKSSNDENQLKLEI